ncbi:MAG: hypothetical protein IJK93_04190 [Muribaculaceae bacterium]|nr:hypothetical protein [Muribaculaceae bacterium]
MKKGILVFASAVLLMSCGHDRHQQDDHEPIKVIEVFSDDTTSLGEQKKDTAESTNQKSQAAKSNTTISTRHNGKTSDNMRGFDPASEDDMDDNGMSRYFENNDEEGWD